MRSSPGIIGFGTLTLPASGSLTSQTIDLTQDYGFACLVAFTGAPSGVFAVQGSCDAGTNPGGTVGQVTNFSTLANSTFTASGVSGSFAVNFEGAFFRYIRFVYAASSGTGTLTAATFSTKGP